MVTSVGVCGAGVMGSGIAQAFAAAGHEVWVYDADPAAVDAALERIQRDLDRGVEKGKVAESDARDTRERLKTASSLDDLASVGLVVEAVIEDLAVKQDLFRKLESICSAQTLLVTNTSTLSPTEIGSVLTEPGRTAGVHFFNPATRMRLVEVIPGERSDSATVDALLEALQGIGKHPVRVTETPGGIVSRLQLLVRNEAVRMVAEGVAEPEDIDAAMRLGAGWPLGPLELIDLVGVDLHVNNCRSLADEFGSSRYAPHPLVVRMARAGKLGKKTGEGFYDYSADR